MDDRIQLIEGDITRQRVDAVVNAANALLRPGGGVDGAIHRAAGPRLGQACAALGGCPTGEARLTPGFGLPAKWIIHTVGPVWRGGDAGEDALLRACYRNSLALAEENRIGSLAFPSIGTGAYGFPPARAAAIALDATRAHLAAGSAIARVVFVCFGRDAYHCHARLIEAGESP